LTHIEIGVPSVWPSKVPERIWTRSASCRGVTMADWPGRGGRGPAEYPPPSAAGEAGNVDDDAHAAPMRFAPGGNAKQMSKRVAHRGSLGFGQAKAQPSFLSGLLYRMAVRADVSKLLQPVGHSCVIFEREDNTAMKNYTAVVERDPETGLLVGYVPGFPGAHSQAESLDELQANLREVIAMLLEDGEPRLEAEFVGTQSIAVA